MNRIKTEVEGSSIHLSNESLGRAKEAPGLPHRPVSFVFHFIRPYKWPLLAMVLLEAAQAACQISIPYAVKKMVDLGVNVSDGQFVPEHFRSSLLLFVGLSLGVLFSSRASGAILMMLGPALRRRVRANLYRYLQYHSHKFFISNFAGSLANRISEVAMSVNHSLWTMLFDFWPIVITFSVSLYLMWQSHSGLATILGVWIFIYVLVSFFLARRCQVYAKKFAATRSLVNGKIVDSVTNMLNTKLFARLEYERRYLSRHLDLEVKTARETFWFMEKMRWFQFIATMILQVAVILMALRYWMQNEITVGAFAMVASLALLIINDARGLSRRFLEFFEFLGNISDGVSIMIRSHEVRDREGAMPIQITKGHIEFRDVGFGYSLENKVFENLNITIRPGERVGLVGFSGSGKTSFVNLILRLYELNSGEIKVDGQNIAEHQQDSLRSQISVIPQEPMLFHRTLLENIRYGRETASDEEVMAAAKAAHAHEFIMNLPEGYQALVGERGVKLSGGQRQRIAIARAILKDAPILILDEATSSLDSITEKSIQAALEKLMENRTVIVVAHRLSTIAHLSRILVFDQGRIVEDGTHEELLLKKNGHYARLWSMQAGGFLPTEAEAVTPENMYLNQ